MRGFAVLAGTVVALALPAAAQAHRSLSVPQAKAAIHAADEHVVIDSCARWSRRTVQCAYSERAFYAGFEVEDPTAEWHSWVTATLHRSGRIALGWE